MSQSTRSVSQSVRSVQSNSQICNGIQIPYDKHYKVSSLVKSHQTTHNSVKYEVMTTSNKRTKHAWSTNYTILAFNPGHKCSNEKQKDIVWLYLPYQFLRPEIGNLVIALNLVCVAIKNKPTEYFSLPHFLHKIEQNCWETNYGCCPDGKTAADGPGKAGCGSRFILS